MIAAVLNTRSSTQLRQLSCSLLSFKFFAGGMMHISAQGYKAAWLCCLACTITFGQQVALASTSADAFVVSGLGQADVRQLQEAVTPDCGLGFQPCCAGEQSCLEDQFTCIAREPVARCEPCGTPFAQPCPQSPYCEATELIPTTSACKQFSV